MSQIVETGIQRAVIAAGGQVKLAETLGVSQQYISLAVRQGYVSPPRAQEIEAEFGIPRHELVNPKLARALNLSTCCC
jgi:DNA-binding transcriptional regulator YdaS (Cro superfamily)